MPEKLRIGLVGIGTWGEKIHQELSRFGVQIHVAEQDGSLESKAKRLGSSTFTINLGLFKKQDLDGIIIASPTTTHLNMIQDLQELGIPLFVEKPLTANLVDALEVKKLSHDQIFLMHIWKYHPGILRLREIIDSGDLGELKGIKSMRTNWTSPRKDTDSLWNLAIHDLTIAETLLGNVPEPRAVSTEFHHGRVRGLVALLGTSPYYHFEVSNRYPDKQRAVRVFGSDGVAILWDEEKDFIELYKGDDRSDLEVRSNQIVSFDSTPPLRLEIADFLNYLKGGSPPKCGIDEGVRLVEYLDRLEKMSKEI